MKTLNLRLSDETHAHLAEIAAGEHRSLNAQVIELIEAEWREWRDTEDTRQEIQQ